MRKALSTELFEREAGLEMHSFQAERVLHSSDCALDVLGVDLDKARPARAVILAVSGNSGSVDLSFASRTFATGVLDLTYSPVAAA